MINHEDSRRVVCAFDSNHVMSIQRYHWHLARCPAKKLREENGLPIYTCPYHRMHIFLNRFQLTDHMAVCDSKPAAAYSMTKDLDKEASKVSEIEELPFGTVVEEEIKVTTDTGSKEPFTDRTNLTKQKNSPPKKRPWSKVSENNTKDRTAFKRKKIDSAKAQKEHDRKIRDRQQ